MQVNDKCYTFLSKRFGRKDNEKRIHFASTLTLLGLNYGENETTGKGYIDIVDFILRSCCNVEANMRIFANSKSLDAFICLNCTEYYLASNRNCKTTLFFGKI